jgi:hypothetical protein
VAGLTGGERVRVGNEQVVRLHVAEEEAVAVEEPQGKEELENDLGNFLCIKRDARSREEREHETDVSEEAGGVRDGEDVKQRTKKRMSEITKEMNFAKNTNGIVPITYLIIG